MDTKVFEIQAQSVKDLKQQIADLRDEIVRLKSTGQDYSQQVGQLQATQRMLNEVMGASKEEAVALEGSYNAINQKMKELKKEYQSTSDAMRRQELAPIIRGLNDQLKEMDANIGNFQRNVGNYASALSSVKQVGNDLTNGFQALAGTLSLTASQQEDTNRVFSTFNNILAVAQGSAGIAGLIGKLVDYTSKAKSAKVAQDALNGSITGMGGAGEKSGASFLKFLKNPYVLAALAAIALAVGLIAYNWDKVTDALSRWFKWNKKSEEEVKKLEKTEENLNKQLKKQTKEFENQAKVDKARGVSQKEILIGKQKLIEKQKEETKAAIETLKVRLDEIKAHSWLQRLLLGENKQAKNIEAQIKSMTKALEELEQSSEDVKFDIEAEGIKEGTEASKKAKETLDELKKAAETAKKEIEKIINGDLKGLDKINQKYEELRKALKKNFDAQLDAYAEELKQKKYTAQANIEYQKKVYEAEQRYALASKVLTKEQEEEKRQYYKETFETAWKYYENHMGVLRKRANEEASIYKGMAGDITGFATDKNIYKDFVSDQKIEELRDNITRWWTTLFEVTKESGSKYVDFVNEVGDDEVAGLTRMYERMLKDEKEFAKQYPEPFITALKSIGPDLLSIEAEERTKLKNFVNGTIDEIEEAIQRENYGILPLLFKKLFDNPPVEQSEELKGAVANYMNEVFRDVAEKITKDEKLSWGKKLDLLKIMGISGDLLDETKKNIAKKEIEDLADSTMKALDGIAKAWSNVIQMKQANLDKDLEAGKISKKQYDEETKRLKKSFENQQKFSIGLAWVNTALAVVKALATSSTWYEGLINSAIALSTGIAQVASIKAQSYNGGGSGVGSIPQLVDRTPQATVGMNYADLVDQQNANPVKVYVTDSDLAEGLNRRRVRVQDTSF